MFFLQLVIKKEVFGLIKAFEGKLIVQKKGYFL
jgi:hypothetical protein